MAEAVAVGGKARTITPAAVVAICFGIATLEGYDIQALGVALPTMTPQLHLGPTAAGAAGSAAMVGLVIGSLVGGWLADRIGRKPVLIGAVVWFAVFSLATTLAFDANSLELARLVTGLGFGGAMPNLIAMATEISKPERRAATTTAMFVGMPAGGSCVSLLTYFAAQGAISPHGFDWRLIFLVGGLAPLLVTPLALMLPETRPEAPQAAVDRRSLVALFGDGRALTTILMWLSVLLTLIVLYIFLNWLPVLAHAKGLTKPESSLVSFSFNMVSIVGGLAGGILADKFGYRWPFVVGYLGLVAVLAILVKATGFWPLIVLAGSVGFFVIWANYALYAIFPLYYAPAVRATGAGAAIAIGRIGAIIGPVTAGWLLENKASPGQLVGSMVVVAVGAGLAAVLLTVVGKPYKA